MTVNKLKPGDLFKFFSGDAVTYIITNKTDESGNFFYVNTKTGEIVLTDKYIRVLPVTICKKEDVVSILSDDILREDKQLIYDALMHEMFRSYEPSKSKHFAASCFADNVDTATKLIKRIKEEWKWDIIL